MNIIPIIILIFILNTFALNIDNKEINIGMCIDSIDKNTFIIKYDSIQTENNLNIFNYKYVAENVKQLNIFGFDKVIIEATISKKIYNISLIKQSSYILENDIKIDLMKKFFNENVIIFETTYGLFDMTSDNSLPYEDFNNVNTNSVMFKFYKDIVIYLIILKDINQTIKVQSSFINMGLKKLGEKESLKIYEKEVINKLIK